MKRVVISLVFLSLAASVQAGEYTDKLSRCFSESTSGRDRTALAKWLFITMAAHPELASIASVSTSERESDSKAFAALFMRLIAEDCNKETRAAIQHEGAEPALRGGFEFLGRLAMQELMVNPAVAAAFGETEKYVDRAKLGAALQAK